MRLKRQWLANMLGYFKFQSEDVAYKDEGKGQAIILLHGFLGNMSVWNPIAEGLKKSFRVIRIDIPGHGKSPAIGYVHDMEMLAEMVMVLVKKLKLRKVCLVGHSLGGYLALAVAEKYPDNISKLVLINSTSRADSGDRKYSRDQLIRLFKQNKETAINRLVPNLSLIHI